MHVIGLDIGTTSICGVLTDSATGEIVHSVTRPNRSYLTSRYEWEYTQDPESIVADIGEIVKLLLALGLPVAGIGFTGQMHGILYVDDRGNRVSPLYTWQDRRGDLPIQGDETPPDGAGWTYAQKLTSLTSYPAATGFGLVTHFYHVVHGQVPEQASAICTIADYAAMKLGGLKRPLMDASMAASLGVFDLEALDFDRPALERAGIAPSLLPSIVPAGTEIGRTEKDIPVFAAIGDNQASFLGSVREIASSLLLNIGTGSQISVFTNRLVRSKHLDTRPFPGGGYLLVGASLSGGKSYALLESFFREACRMFAGYDGESLYERMNEMAGQALTSSISAGSSAASISSPGPMAKAGAADVSDLKVNTQFYGTRLDPLKKGSIEHISDQNWTPSQLILGFLEGIVQELFDFYQQFPGQVQTELTALVGSGNGVQNNPVLVKLLERRFGLPLLTPGHREEASYGAALCAGVGCGFYLDFHSIHSTL